VGRARGATEGVERHTGEHHIEQRGSTPRNLADGGEVGEVQQRRHVFVVVGVRAPHSEADARPQVDPVLEPEQRGVDGIAHGARQRRMVVEQHHETDQPGNTEVGAVLTSRDQGERRAIWEKNPVRPVPDGAAAAHARNAARRSAYVERGNSQYSSAANV
jgi:hypothetical protein